MKVMIGCPIRDREWIVRDYLHSILSLNFYKKDIILCFIVNDSTDRTEDILADFAKKFGRMYNKVIILRKDFEQIKDARISYVRQQIYHTLPLLRNMLLEKAREENVDYLFSVDSDILFEPDTLNKLISCNKSIVSAQIWNDLNQIFPNVLIYNNGRHTHFKDFPRDCVFECDVTGAIYLIRKDVLDSNVNYDYHLLGEDIAFCENAKSKGFSIHCDPRIQCCHIMNSAARREE